MRVIPMGQLQANYTQNGSVTTFLAAEPDHDHISDNHRVGDTYHLNLSLDACLKRNYLII